MQKYQPTLVLLEPVNLWILNWLLTSKPSLNHEALDYMEMHHQDVTMLKPLRSPVVKNAVQL